MLDITPLIDLQQFCGFNDSRDYLNQPFNHGDYTYATNGYIAVRVPLRADVSKAIDNPVHEIIDGLVSTTGAHRAIPNYNMPAPHTCKHCNGTGKVAICHECGGNGEVECECCGHCRECEDCDGNGVISGGGVQCESCGGVGSSYKQPVMFGQSKTMGINPVYLQQIEKLPGVLINLQALHTLDAVTFTFDGGGIGAVMPMRK